MNLPTFNEVAAGSKHVLSYGAGLVTMAAMWGLVSGGQAHDLTNDINLIGKGFAEVTEGVVGIVATLTSVWAGYKAMKNASPNANAVDVAENVHLVTNEAKQAIVNAVAPSIGSATGAAKLEAINAVGEMPEVQKVVTTAQIAKDTPSDKVVASH